MVELQKVNGEVYDGVLNTVSPQVEIYRYFAYVVEFVIIRVMLY